MGILYRICLLLIAVSILGCIKTGQDRDDNIFTRYRKPGDFNFKFVGYDFDIDNPKKDRRAYYKIYINKVEEGRTVTGLESQKKSFEAKLPPNRHLLVVEKWVLDEKEKRYKKLNNIEQPKPNYKYFNINKDRIAVIELKTDRDGKASFSFEYEKE